MSVYKEDVNRYNRSYLAQELTFASLVEESEKDKEHYAKKAFHAIREFYESPYACQGALVYRLSSPTADHYYFINDGEAKNVVFRSLYTYQNAVDALTGEPVDISDIALRADDARWIRMEK